MSERYFFIPVGCRRLANLFLNRMEQCMPAYLLCISPYTIRTCHNCPVLSNVSIQRVCKLLALTDFLRGMTCSADLWCRGAPPDSDVPVWSVYTDKWGIEGAMTSTHYDHLSILAKPIFVAFQSSDQSIIQAARLSAHAATQTGAGSSGANSTLDVQPSDRDSLSVGAIAGIVVGSAAGGVLFATIITFVFLRFCLGYRRMPKNAPYGYLEGEEKRRGGSMQLRELDSTNEYSELHAQSRAELAVPLKELERLPELGEQK
jgi:hypothetical protein